MDNNPYQAPQSKVADVVIDGEQKRSKVPKVLGIILLVLTVFGIIGLVTTVGMMLSGSDVLKASMEAQGFTEGYLYFSTITGVLASIWMVFIAIQLIRYRDQGRKHFTYYMIYMLISVPLSFIYQWVSVSGDMQAALLPGMIGSVVAVGLYGFFWYLLNKDKTKVSLT